MSPATTSSSGPAHYHNNKQRLFHLWKVVSTTGLPSNPSETPHRLEFCEYRQTSDVESLNVSGELPYPCHVCGKRFNQSWNRNVHMRVHSGIHPHRCKMCCKNFRSAVRLREHLSVIHALPEVSSHVYTEHHCPPSFPSVRLYNC